MRSQRRPQPGRPISNPWSCSHHLYKSAKARIVNTRKKNCPLQQLNTHQQPPTASLITRYPSYAQRMTMCTHSERCAIHLRPAFVRQHLHSTHASSLHFYAVLLGWHLALPPRLIKTHFSWHPLECTRRLVSWAEANKRKRLILTIVIKSRQQQHAFAVQPSLSMPIVHIISVGSTIAKIRPPTIHPPNMCTITPTYNIVLAISTPLYDEDTLMVAHFEQVLPNVENKFKRSLFVNPSKAPSADSSIPHVYRDAPKHQVSAHIDLA